jgi:hypothetical protein
VRIIRREHEIAAVQIDLGLVKACSFPQGPFEIVKRERVRFVVDTVGAGVISTTCEFYESIDRKGILVVLVGFGALLLIRASSKRKTAREIGSQ